MNESKQKPHESTKRIEERNELLFALRLCRDLLDNSDVRHYISNELGEQAQLHAALNAARKALANRT